MSSERKMFKAAVNFAKRLTSTDFSKLSRSVGMLMTMIDNAPTPQTSHQGYPSFEMRANTMRSNTTPPSDGITLETEDDATGGEDDDGIQLGWGRPPPSVIDGIPGRNEGESTDEYARRIIEYVRDAGVPVTDATEQYIISSIPAIG